MINADKHAAYPLTLAELQEDKRLPQSSELRQNKYLNNVIEQEHRFLQKEINQNSGSSLSTHPGEQTRDIRQCIC